MWRYIEMSESDTQIWTNLETALGERVSSEERFLWYDDIDSYKKGRIAIDVLADKIRNTRDYYGVRSRSRQPRGEMASGLHTRMETRSTTPTRPELLAAVIAINAEQDAMVRHFRQDVLQGRLLPWSEIQGWIRQQWDRETAQELPKLSLKVPLPPNHNYHSDSQGLIPDPPVYVGKGHPALGIQKEALEYAIPDDAWVHRIPIAYGGVLARLQQLSLKLAGRYRWQPALATVFVLTGLMPVTQPIQDHCDWSFLETHAGRMTALSCIVLTLDPTLTPQEVGAAFQRIRQSILGAKWRDLNDKQLALARFTLHRDEEESWTQRMEAWNEECGKKWPYTRISNFKRDCHNALKKLLAPVSIEYIFPESEDNNAETPRES
jgi:hypothetical protein